MLTGILLALGSALAWSALDISRKRLGVELSATAAVAWLTLLQLPILVGLMALGEAGVGAGFHFGEIAFGGGFPDALPDGYWRFALGTIALNLAANFLFFRAVQISPLGLTIPYLSFTPVFSAAVAYLTLGEAPTPVGAVGISIVCAGAFFLNPGASEGGLLAPLRALWTERGSLYMVVVALLWSISPVIDKKGAEATSEIVQTAVIAAGIGVAFFVIRTVRDRSPRPILAELMLSPLFLLFCAGLNVAAMILQLGAYDFTDVAYVETVKRAVGVIGAVLAGWLIFGEGDLRRRVVAAAIMVFGVALILI